MPERTVSLHLEEKGLEAMIDAMRTLQKPPSFKVTAILEGNLASAFAKTQAQTHVISGRLKASGRTESDLRGHVWEGSILYGGPKGSPAYYAIYELNRGGTRPDGTPHDFFSGLEAFDKGFEKAIDEFFAGLG